MRSALNSPEIRPDHRVTPQHIRRGPLGRLCARASTLLLPMLLLLYQVGCSPSEYTPERATSTRTQPSANSASTGSSVQARPVHRTIRASRHADGSLRTVVGLHIPLNPAAQDPGVSSRHLDPATVLDQVRGLRLGSSLLSDPRLSLKPVRDEHDPSGHRHLRFQAKYADLELADGWVDLHLSGQVLTGVSSSLPVPTTVEGKPPRPDLERLRTELLAQEGLELESAGHELAFFQRPAGSVFVGIKARALGRRGAEAGQLFRVVLDARSGRLWQKQALVETLETAPPCPDPVALDCSIQASGVGDDGRTRTIQVYRGSAFPPPVLLDEYVHPLTDPRYPDLIQGAYPDDSFFVDLSQAGTQGAHYVIDSNGSIANPADLVGFDDYDHIPSGPGTSFTNQSTHGRGVSALFSVRAALDYFSQQHGRMGLSGDALQPVDIVTRVGLSGLNAAWVSDYNYMLFGSFGGQSLAVAVDVAGHELTHGVLRHSANLGNQQQTGALNEALADMFGVLIEAHAEGTLDWFIAEDIAGFPPLRNLKNPQLFGMPEHMSQYVVTTGDNGGVHTNMSIPCKAFALAVEGTRRRETFYGYSVPPADPEVLRSAELVGRVLYRALVDRLVPTSQFEDWALSMLAAADDAGLSPDQTERVYQSLLASFYATGILADSASTSVTYLTGRVLSSVDGQGVPAVTLDLIAEGQVYETVTSNDVGVYQAKLPSSSLTQVLAVLSRTGYYSSNYTLNVAQAGALLPDTLEQDLLLTPRPAPVLQTQLLSSEVVLPRGGSAEVILHVENAGPQNSELSASARPVVTYSVNPNATFDWLDVPGVGAPVTLTGDQEHSEAIPLPQPFPFYGQSYNTLYISTDGYVTMVPDPSYLYQEYLFPDPRAPRALISPYWADLDFDSSNKAYFYYVAGSAWVQFEDVWDYFDDQHYTFQVQLRPEGTIRFQYAQLSGPSISWGLVGIQDEAGQEGALHALVTQQDPSQMPQAGDVLELVPSFWPAAEGAELLTSSTVLGAGCTLDMYMTLRPGPLSPGKYGLNVRVDHNDPTQGTVYLPLTIWVE